MDLVLKVRKGDYVILPSKELHKRYASSCSSSRHSSRASGSYSVSASEDALVMKRKFDFIDAVTDEDESVAFSMLEATSPMLNNEAVEAGLCVACCRNQIGWLKRFASDERARNALDDGRALACCAYYGSLDAGQYLLSDEVEPPVDPCAGEMFAVEMAAEQGQTAFFALLLHHPRFAESLNNVNRLSKSPSTLAKSQRSSAASMSSVDSALRHTPVRDTPSIPRWNRIWRAAVFYGHLDIVSVLLGCEFVPVDDEFLTCAAETGRVDFLNLALSHPRSAHLRNGASLLSEALSCAASSDHTEAVDRLLCEDGCDPTWNGLQALRDAIHGGCIESLRRILNDSRVSPSADDNSVLRAAVDHCDRTIIDLIITHPRFDASVALLPMVDMCVILQDFDTLNAILAHPSLPRESIQSTLRHAIRSACVFGSRKALEELIEDTRLSDSDSRIVRLQCAAWKGDIGVVKDLLADSHLDAGADRSECLVFACAQGHADVVEVLLQDSRIDPSCGGSNEAIARACMAGDRQLAIVKMLLNDARVDPSARNNKAWRAALRAFPSDALRELLSADERVARALENSDSEDEYSDSEDCTC
eukprot:ANDGO_03048.mRNA.1 hypothetical protein SARC_05782